MYAVVYGGLITLFTVAFVFSFFGLVFYSPLSLLFTFLILTGSCFVSNIIFATIFKAPVNPISSVITAAILFFVMMPISKTDQIWVFVLASALAMGSKYIMAINKRHIFNPAAFALVTIGLMGLPQINWWVGNSYLFPVVLITGLFVVRKVRKLVMFSTYYIFGLATIGIFAVINNREVLGVLTEAILSYPILFLGAYMLVEPLTTPPKRNTQGVYAVIVGVLQGAQYQIGPIFSTPELGILIGNVYSYLVSFRRRLVLRLKEARELSPTIYEFIFAKDKMFNFEPGQYFEWTLPHFPFDFRGVRRFFTIASSPTEDTIKIGIKIDPQKGSTFKKALVGLKPGEKIYAGELSGDFIMPKKNNKYIFMAGGIGVTPFRSIIKNMIDKNEKADVVLFYSVSDDRDFVYKDVFDSAKVLGIKTVFVCSDPSNSWKGKSGRIDAKLISEEVPDYKDRIAYLSGPNVMVTSYKKLLNGLGIKPNRIVTDYFPGF